MLRRSIRNEKTAIGEFLGEEHLAGLVVVDENEIDAFVAVAGAVAIL